MARKEQIERMRAAGFYNTEDVMRIYGLSRLMAERKMDESKFQLDPNRIKNSMRWVGSKGFAQEMARLGL